MLRAVTQNHKGRKYSGACQGLGQGENGKLLFNGCRVSVLQEKKGYGEECGDAYTTVLIDLTPLNCTLKMVKLVSFMLCVFYHIQKKN